MFCSLPRILRKLSRQVDVVTVRHSLGILAQNNNYSTEQNKAKDMFHQSVTNLDEVKKETVEMFLNSFDTVLTDCDGVLWIDKSEIEGSAETLNVLRNLGKKIFYVTNNSTKSRAEFAEKAQTMGFVASEDEILSTAYLVAHYLKSIDFKKTVYIVGSAGIAKELDAVGIEHTGVGPDLVTPDYRSLKSSELNSEVGAVVVGFDEHLSYPKLMKAASYLLSEDVLFIATNTDERGPKNGGVVIPGSGTMVRAVETCAERKALVLGKPHSYVREFLDDSGLDPARTLMIGDRCNTDIELGLRCGFQTLLVLSGVTSKETLEKMKANKTPPLPDVVLPKLGALLPLVPL